MSRHKYLSQRAAKPSTIGTGLPAIIAALVPLRREAMDAHDLCLIEQASDPNPGEMEEAAQSCAALVRELSTLLDQVKKCQAIVEQINRVEARLRENA